MKDGLMALVQVKKEYRDMQVVVFGEEPNAEDARLLSILGDVEFHRFPYGDRMRRIYNTLDIFLFPSHEEGYGNPPMEAMACGVACVSTRVGAVPDYSVPYKTALIVEPGQVEEVANAVLLLLKDEERRIEMSDAGLSHIKEFSWDKTVSLLEGFFNEVLS